jgi:hypothetical protein
MSTDRDGPTAPRLLAGLALTAATAAASATLSLLPRPGEPVAILAPFGTQTSMIAAIAQAGGTLAGWRSDAIALAMPGGPDFVSRLRMLGYWLVLDVRAVDFCGAGNVPSRRNP